MEIFLLPQSVEHNVLHLDWLLTSLKLPTSTHQSLDASGKWWVEYSTTFPKLAGLIHLLHFVHSFCTSPEAISSHAVFPWHNFWVIYLHFKINGAVKPSGSYTESNSDSIPLFFAGLSFSDTLNPNVSAVMFHTTSNTLSFCSSSFESSLMLMFFSSIFLWNWSHRFNLVAYKLCQIESSSFPDISYPLD